MPLCNDVFVSVSMMLEVLQRPMNFSRHNKKAKHYTRNSNTPFQIATSNDLKTARPYVIDQGFELLRSTHSCQPLRGRVAQDVSLITIRFKQSQVECRQNVGESMGHGCRDCRSFSLRHLRFLGRKGACQGARNVRKFIGRTGHIPRMLLQFAHRGGLISVRLRSL